MGIGKYFYWILWLPVFIIKMVAKIVFVIASIFNFLHAIAEGLHEEIKEF